MDRRDAAWRGTILEPESDDDPLSSKHLSEAYTARNNALKKLSPVCVPLHFVAQSEVKRLTKRMDELGHNALNVLAFVYLGSLLKPYGHIGKATWLGIERAQEGYERGEVKPHQLALAYAARARWTALIGPKLSGEMRTHLRELTQRILELRGLIHGEVEQPQGLRQLVRALKHLAIAHRKIGERQAAYSYACDALTLAEGAADAPSQVPQLRRLVRRYSR